MERTKGYDMGIVLAVETREHLKTFATSAGHLRSVLSLHSTAEHKLIKKTDCTNCEKL